MTIKGQVLLNCIELAKVNKHGHMTLYDIHCVSDFTSKQVKNAVLNLRRNGAFRTQTSWKFRDNCLIRELKEDIWQAPAEIEINSVRYQLKQANKHVDALKIKYDQAVERANKHMSEVNRIRHAWREFNNLMTERR